ncbi:hypothetical protein C0J52_07930 [Blattella germanica]|nr:hypothetical protein C0J52_07930 [Blattella germanica]
MVLVKPRFLSSKICREKRVFKGSTIRPILRFVHRVFRLSADQSRSRDSSRGCLKRAQRQEQEQEGGGAASVGSSSSNGNDRAQPTPDIKRNGVPEGHKHVSKSQMKEFREAFRLFDKDGDGSITQEELGRVMRSLGDGNVSFEEFVEIVSNMGAATDRTADQEEKELRDAFRVFDKHNRGYISASDLRAVLQCLGEDLSEEEIEDMIKEVDVDGDGRIDFYEFVHALGEPGEEEDGDEDEDERDEAGSIHP